MVKPQRSGLPFFIFACPKCQATFNVQTLRPVTCDGCGAKIELK